MYKYIHIESDDDINTASTIPSLIVRSATKKINDHNVVAILCFYDNKTLLSRYVDFSCNRQHG
jgi:hypothetical protein